MIVDFIDHAKRVEILKLSLEELLDALKQKRFTAEEVVVAFCLQVREVCGPQTPINAVSETYFEEALEQGSYLFVYLFIWLHLHQTLVSRLIVECLTKRSTCSVDEEESFDDRYRVFSEVSLCLMTMSCLIDRLERWVVDGIDR